MKHLKLLFIPILLLIIACSTTRTPFVTEYDTQMMNSFEGYFTVEQFDSICAADSIESDLNMWHMIPLRDAETKENVSQYLYIKSLGEHENIYRVQKIDSVIYKITKRITK